MCNAGRGHAAADCPGDVPAGVEAGRQCLQLSGRRQVSHSHIILIHHSDHCDYSLIGGSDYKLIYRHYATLYFVFCVDSSESELGILDLIQVSHFPVGQRCENTHNSAGVCGNTGQVL